jgi:pyrroline-5-carboxylate reductase
LKLGFIGTGKIASSVIKKIAQSLKKKFNKIKISKTNQEIINNSDWVFLSVTPTVGKKIIKHLNFKSNQMVISFISTISLSQLKKMIKKKVDIVRAIPLPPISLKVGPIPINKKGVKKLDAQKYVTSLFLALSKDAVINSNKDLKLLVKDSQTPKGLNEQGLKEMSKNKVYKSIISTLNSIHKRLDK